MREIIVRRTPQLRRYAHALLGSWPAASRTADGRPRPDQEADDLAQEALLGFWRADRPSVRGGLRNDVAGPTFAFGPEHNQILLLYRRVTELARKKLAQKTNDGAAPPVLRRDGDAPGDRLSHYAWAPESRALPRIPFEFRALLALVALERLSYDQVGEVLDMPGERALARLTVARARLASEISGESRPHLLALSSLTSPDGRNLRGGRATEGDLHSFVDDLLDAGRREEIIAYLESNPETTRRVSEWRRHSERLRLAFEPLMREPLPPSLNFSSPPSAIRPGWRGGARRRRGFFAGLAAILAASTGPTRARPH